MFFVNLVLTGLIIFTFESKPQGLYPSLSQKYHRSKVFEPHLDVKYLLQYKEFKLYAIVCSIILGAINSSGLVSQVFQSGADASAISYFDMIFVVSPIF